MHVRQPAVAGLFYERDPHRLQQEVDALLQQRAVPAQRPLGLIVPHAGYRYSGAVAAIAYHSLVPLRHRVRRVILLGPAHRVYLRGMAVPTSAIFATPLGDVPLDRAALRLGLQCEGTLQSDEAHREEHSLEVQLPFLQTVLDAFTLVPVVVGHCDRATVAALIDTLWTGEGDLLVVSTDLSHFHNYDTACRLDAATCRRIRQHATDLDGEEACGARPLNGLMSSTLGDGMRVEQLAACNSGDTGGDRERVVGYASFLLH